MKKHIHININLILIIFFLAGISPVLCQTFEMYPLSFNYPKWTVSFKLTDSSGKVIYPPNIPDIYVKYNAYYQKAEVISCEEPVKDKISVIFLLDISKTMDSKIPELSCDRISFEKEFVRNAVKMLPQDSSRWEAAIIIFNHQSTLLLSFTNSKTKLNEAINSDSIYAHGGCDYNLAFYTTYKDTGSIGALNLSNSARYKPLVIMVSDGFHNESAEFPAKDTTVKSSAIISNANNTSRFRIATIINSVFIDNETPYDLKQIVQSTGGQSIVTNSSMYSDSANQLNVINELFDKVLNSGIEYFRPCYLSWTLDCTWRGGVYEIVIPDMKNLGAVWQFGDRRPTLFFEPKTLEFLSDTSTFQTAKVTISSDWSKGTLTNIKFNTPGIEIVDWGGSPPPFKMDSSRTVTINMNIEDKNFESATAEIQTDICKYDNLKVIRIYKDLLLDAPYFYRICPDVPTQIGNDILVKGGKKPYRYLWNPKNGLSSDTVLNPLVNSNQDRTYSFTFFDSRNYSATKNIYLYVDTLPTPKIVYLKGRVKERDTTYYMASAVQNVVNKWTVTNGTLLTPEEGDSVVVRWAKAGSGVLYLKQTIKKTGCFAYDSMTVTVDVNTGAEDGTNDYDCNSFRIKNFNFENQNGVVSFDISLNQNNNASIELVNLLGTVISSKEVNAGDEHVRMQAENLAAGMYFLIIKTKDCNSVRKIFIGGN